MGPFLTALMDWAINGTGLQRYHIVGMSFMVACAVLVALSKLFGVQEDIDVPEDEQLPIIVPILMSLMMPTVGGLFSILNRYVTVDLGKSA